MAEPQAVLFACGHNAVRSPMAAALLRQMRGTTLYIASAGVRTAALDPFAVAVMEEIGIDISRHRPKTFEDLEDTSFDLVISLSPEAQHKAVELTRTMDCTVEFWPVIDPGTVEGSREAQLDVYRDVRDHLLRRILKRFPVGPAVQV